MSLDWDDILKFDASSEPSWLGTLLSFRYFFTKIPLEKSLNKATLVTKGVIGNRNDFNDIYNNITPHIGGDWVCVDWKIYSWSFPKARNISKAYKLFRSLNDRKNHLFPIIVCMLTILDELSSNGVPDKVVVFSSSHSFDALLVEYYNSLEVDTFSLQHGYYDKVGYNSFEAEILRVSKAKFHLLWDSISQIRYANLGIEKERTIIAGYPKTRLPYKFQTNGRVLVFLSRRKYSRVNVECLKELVSIFPVHQVRFVHHPSDSKNNIKRYERYAIRAPLMDDIYQFFITVNTSVGLELRFSSLPCIEYVDPSFEPTHSSRKNFRYEGKLFHKAELADIDYVKSDLQELADKNEYASYL